MNFNVIILSNILYLGTCVAIGVNKYIGTVVSLIDKCPKINLNA